ANHSMLASNQIALKEWAIVTAALAAGRQTMLLRTGGIDEGPEGFRVKHGEFWLLPTRFHQDPAAIVPEAHDLWHDAQAQQATASVFRVQIYAVAQEVFRVGELAAAERLAREQVLSQETIRQRFAY